MTPDSELRMYAAQATTDLPAGFSALWMETAVVKLSCGTQTFDAQPDAADQLCCLLSCAPASYRHVRSANCALDCYDCID